MANAEGQTTKSYYNGIKKNARQKKKKARKPAKNASQDNDTRPSPQQIYTSAAMNYVRNLLDSAFLVPILFRSFFFFFFLFSKLAFNIFHSTF